MWFALDLRSELCRGCGTVCPAPCFNFFFCPRCVILGGTDQLVVANVGDSRAILCRGGRAEEVSPLQTPSREDERDRIQAAGTFVWVTFFCEYYGVRHNVRVVSQSLNPPLLSFAHALPPFHPPCVLFQPGGAVVWFGTWRVNGTLAVSRSIGDKEFEGLVIPTPEIARYTLQDDDSFLLLVRF